MPWKFGIVAGLMMAFAVTGDAMGAEKIETAAGTVEITPVHHASLYFTVGGKHIFVDPAPLEETGNAIRRFRDMPKPDLILYTHSHYDHFNAGVLEAILTPDTKIIAPAETATHVPAALRARVQVMGYGDKTEALGVGIEAVAMYNTTADRMKFHPKGFGNGYVLTIGGKRIYVAGDTEETPEIAHLPNIDAAFVPVNLPYTMAMGEAAKWVQDFRPHVVYPYHYRNADGTLTDMAAFKTLVGDAAEVRVLGWY